MSDSLSIALAQINPTVGDVRGNLRRILEARAGAAGADLVVFPELSLSGYPPEDLVLKGAFLDSVKEGVAKLAAATAEGGPAILVGAPWRIGGKRHNAALLLDGGELAAVALKRHLPNYGVFDEARLFAGGAESRPLPFRGTRLGVMICEDMSQAEVAGALGRAGAELLIVMNGSPFELNKPDARLDHARMRVAETGLPLIYLNQVGGQDELVFDGASFVLDRRGETCHRLPSWREAVVATGWSRGGEGMACAPGGLAAQGERLESIYQAMMLGLRDYVGKNRFSGVLLGLSGGVDSALSAAVAVDALGPDRVWGVVMPSPLTAQESLDDAAAVARLNGIRLDSIAIDPAMQAFDRMLSGIAAGAPADPTEEGVPAHSRGLALMTLGRRSGWMVLSTGNKSEMSVGCSTLHGDICGGYSVLKDLYKTTVFEVAGWRNRQRPEGGLGPAGPVMPERVIARSAGTRPGRREGLPPYAQLDAILQCLIEQEMGPAETIAAGHAPAAVQRVVRLLDRAEHQRRQAPPGVKITSRAFGRDRRYPIVNGFTDTI